MKFIKNYAASMKLTGILMILIAAASAIATFIENDFGPKTSKALIYNALWFETVLFIAALNLAASIYRYRMWKKDKITILLFHLSFIIVIIGAGMTRFFGYEGMMRIRENSSSSNILSERTYIQTEVKTDGKLYREDKEVLLSSLSYNSFTIRPHDDVVIRYKDFYDNAVESLRSSPDGKPAVVLVVSSGGTPDDFTLFAGETYDAGSFIIDFSSGRTFTKPSVKIILDRDDFLFSSPFPVTYMQMADQKSGNLPAGVWNPLSGGKLHTVHGVSFVVRDTKKSAVHTVVKSSQKTNLSAVIVSVESGSEVREVALPGTESSVGQLQKLTLGNKEISLRYGSKNIELPFSLHLTDFIVERYPGSNSPSSYESKVILIDPEMNIKEPKRIYMNHILVHRGFRFYQSSFDPDERGTVLSVAKDPGMIPTYLGYFLMTVGLLFNLFNRRARFGRLTKQVAKEGEKS